MYFIPLKSRAFTNNGRYDIIFIVNSFVLHYDDKFIDKFPTLDEAIAAANKYDAILQERSDNIMEEYRKSK